MGGAVFLGAKCPRGNYAGNKQSERQFSLGAIGQGDIVRGLLSSRHSSEGQLSRGQLSGRQLSQHRSIVFPEKLQKIQKKTTLVESVLEKFSRQKAANLQKKIPWWMFSWNFGTFSQKRCSVEHLTRVASENKLDPVEPSLNIIKVSSPNVASNIN